MKRRTVTLLLAAALAVGGVGAALAAGADPRGGPKVGLNPGLSTAATTPGAPQLPPQAAAAYEKVRAAAVRGDDTPPAPMYDPSTPDHLKHNPDGSVALFGPVKP